MIEKATGAEFEIELVGDAGQEGYSYELYPEYQKEIHSCEIGPEIGLAFAVVSTKR